VEFDRVDERGMGQEFVGRFWTIFHVNDSENEIKKLKNG
jgi:hypothetical protein